ncbi:sugar phosphate isomerase/epimerase family protein [Georgenia thermotolerans]|uniref:TIM barrel protein n=1 Tax=Georgenia thermotolerans TaxID=527326 RepID=A0A7J5UN34_9MICO|nr:sugar phosphate isomerase/epimerase family protein [Georgenia thermotolerans]KAE8763769.1 TIM barrel protein [Georgenia thermotolerans]
MSLTLAYGTNGFADHRLSEALSVVAGLGYDGVALTLDHGHLDPFAPDLPARVAAVRRLLERHGLAVAVETGARYLLDPWHKHEPTLVSDTGREVRVDLLRRAVDVAADLGAGVVSLWSGILPAGVTAAEGWSRVLSGLEAVLPHAERAGVVLAVEPEPGMFLDRLAAVLELRRRLGDPDHLRVTLDIGHLVCNETDPPPALVGQAAGLLAHVQIDDMRRGVHEHLEFGEGEVDLPPVLAALEDAGYAGLVAVELPRHSHAAPLVARRSLEALRAALGRAREHRVPRPAPIPEVLR